MFRAHGPRLPRMYANLLGLLTFISSSKQEQIIKVHTLHCGSQVNNVNYVNFTCTIRQSHLTGFIIVHLIILSNEKKTYIKEKTESPLLAFTLAFTSDLPIREGPPQKNSFI